MIEQRLVVRERTWSGGRTVRRQFFPNLVHILKLLTHPTCTFKSLLCLANFMKSLSENLFDMLFALDPRSHHKLQFVTGDV